MNIQKRESSTPNRYSYGDTITYQQARMVLFGLTTCLARTEKYLSANIDLGDSRAELIVEAFRPKGARQARFEYRHILCLRDSLYAINGCGVNTSEMYLRPDDVVRLISESMRPRAAVLERVNDKAGECANKLNMYFAITQGGIVIKDKAESDEEA